MSRKNKATSALNERLSKCSITDSGNAERLEARYGDKLRYDHTAKGWRIYYKGLWCLDDKGEAVELMQHTARLIWEEAETIENANERGLLGDWSERSLNHHGLKAALTVAQSLPTFRTEALYFPATCSEVTEWLERLRSTKSLLQESAKSHEWRKEVVIREVGSSGISSVERAEPRLNNGSYGGLVQ